MKIEDLHKIFLRYPSVCTDTRKLLKNDIFFALKGENFNGNEYAKKAIENGATYAIIDEERFFVDDRTIIVKNALTTLQRLANFHRNYSKARVIALTGSNGKTTTKELINAVLSKKYRTIATIGNLNNHIGVPLTLLSIKKDTEIAIVEMGANHQKEIEFLSGLTEPDFGYITNFGKAHLEGFGGVKGVIKGKSELYTHLIAENKGIFMNADDPIQKEKLASYINKYGFSTSDPSFTIIKMPKANPFVEIEIGQTHISTKLIGSYNFPNCCAAILMGKYFNVPDDMIKIGLESYLPDNNRSQVIEKKGHKIILDAYNANPTSMKAALENFSQIEGDRKCLFLGDMFELGEQAKEEHQNIAELAQALELNNTCLIGENFYEVKSDFKKFKTYNDLKDYLRSENIPKNSSMLIKGSRGMALERILEIL
ncbi:UDP-N-acetylmuramoyl-tripeptide--D-alanyl-D-alanine ligase [Maribacter sp. R77961]|uniref:UDP-N-acetylmuramoyl-tripeptide--D-alanyl-D- alanine ligase n=1 Tax=Maribacter sp. R77961 TaxID=3093871 RepID=UPI0037CAF501